MKLLLVDHHAVVGQGLRALLPVETDMEVVGIKTFEYRPGAEYPDFGCNNEAYTTRDYMEVESLGPLRTLEPGQAAEHIENWFLFREVVAGTTEASLETAISPLVEQVRAIGPNWA